MKKWKYAWCALLSVVCMSAVVMAAGTYKNIGELDQHWSMNSVPDWGRAVCNRSRSFADIPPQRQGKARECPSEA